MALLIGKHKKYLGNINKLEHLEKLALAEIIQIALLKGEKIEQLSGSDNHLLLDISLLRSAKDL